MFHVKVGNQSVVYTVFKLKVCEKCFSNQALVTGRLQHDSRSPLGSRLDRQMPTKHSHLRVDLRHDHSRLETVQRARLSQESARLHRQGRQSPHSRVRFGQSARAVHPARNLLGTNESEGTHLLCCRSYRKSIAFLAILFVKILNFFFISIGKQLLQDVHHMDESKDQENLCPAKHVRIQTHQAVR